MNKKIKLEVPIIGIVVLVVLLLAAVSTAIILSNRSKPSYNINKSFTRRQIQQGVTFDNIKCYYDGKDSLITYVISNNTDQSIKLQNYEVLIKDKNDTIITNIYIDFNEELAPKTKKNVKNKVLNRDLSNAYAMELDLKVEN